MPTSLLGSINSELGNIELGFASSSSAEILSDSLTFSQTFSVHYVRSRSLSHSLALTDQWSKTHGDKIALAQSLTFISTFSYVQIVAKTRKTQKQLLLQSISFTSVLSKLFSRKRSISQSLTFNSVFNYTKSHLVRLNIYANTLNQSINFQDSFKAKMIRARIFNDSLAFRSVVIPWKLLIQKIEFTDSLQKSAKTNRRWSDQLSFKDFLSVDHYIRKSIQRTSTFSHSLSFQDAFNFTQISVSSVPQLTLGSLVQITTDPINNFVPPISVYVSGYALRPINNRTYSFMVSEANKQAIERFFEQHFTNLYVSDESGAQYVASLQKLRFTRTNRGIEARLVLK